MNEKIDQLYCDSNVQILFDKLDNTITYYTQHRKSIPPIHLDDKLQFIQLYKDSGDLIVSCSSGTKKIYICKRNRLYTLKHESNNLVYILDQSFIVDDTDPIPKVWQIYDDKLKLLTYNKYHINNNTEYSFRKYKIFITGRAGHSKKRTGKNYRLCFCNSLFSGYYLFGIYR